MSHELESMFYTSREKVWHGLGRPVDAALKSADALKMTGLDWVVERQPVFLPDNVVIPNRMANVRKNARKIDLETGKAEVDETGRELYHPDTVLGILSDSYSVIQNAEAFSFTDNLIGKDVRYDTAGSLKGGRCVWLLAKMPRVKILGDDVEPFLCFSNSHDGSSAVRVCCTPVRVVCNNTLNLALKTAKRSWRTRHVGDLSSKMDDAKKTLRFADNYIAKLTKTAETLVNKSVSNGECKDFVEQVFPMPSNDDDKPETRRKMNNAMYFWNFFNFCYMQKDVEKFRGTKWGLINSLSDAVYHGDPSCKANGGKENLWHKSMNGNAIMDRAMDLLLRDG